MSLVSLYHTAHEHPLRWSTRPVILLEYYTKNLKQNVSRVGRHWNKVHEEKGSPADRPARFRRSAHKVELKDTQNEIRRADLHA